MPAQERACNILQSHFDDDAAEHDAHDGDQDKGAYDAAREAETERSQVFCHQGFNGRYVA